MSTPKNLDFKQIQAKRIKKAIKSIDKIEVKIHRMVLTGPYFYPDLEKVFGPLRQVEKGAIPEKRMGIYNSAAYLTVEGIDRMTFFYNIKIDPLHPYRYSSCPKVRIEFSNPKKEFLVDLDNNLPRLNVSRVEYTIDIYPHYYTKSGKSIPKATKRLFSVLNRHLFYPRQKRNIFNFSDKAKKAGVIDILKGMNNGNRVNEYQYYERGSDDSKQCYIINPKNPKGKGIRYPYSYWPRESIDRVRLEYNVPRRILVKHGISSLLDFIQNTKFREINEKVYGHFRRFTSEEFYNGRLYGKKGFQELYIKAQKKPGSNKNSKRKQVVNIRKCVEDVTEFERLKKRLVAAMIDFEETWKNGLKLRW